MKTIVQSRRREADERPLDSLSPWGEGQGEGFRNAFDHSRYVNVTGNLW